MFVKVNGIQLFYEQSGMGRPLILVHGNGEDHTIFDEAVDVLKERYACYAIDSRGHGQSAYDGQLHYQDMADDITAMIEKLDLHNVIYYGFSDGGIIGLLAAEHSDRIKDLIISGTNLEPDDMKPWLYKTFKMINHFKKDDKISLMLKEPHITDEVLHNISARTLVLAGSKDLVKQDVTEHIAKTIPHGELRILAGEGHGSYIVHNRKVADIIMAFAG